MSAVTNIENFKENLWESWADELVSIKKQKASIKVREEEIKIQAIEFMGDDVKYAHKGLKMFQRTTKGTMKWKEVPEIADLDVDYLDGFRGESKTSWVMEVQ